MRPCLSGFHPLAARKCSLPSTVAGGVSLLAEAARRLGIAESLTTLISDMRDPARVIHPLSDILLTHILAIACGYEDATYLDSPRYDPAFKLGFGRLPQSVVDLMSQSTESRWENALGLRDLIKLGRAIVDLYCASYATPLEAVVLDIDDTVDVVHGRQQPSLFNGHYGEHCFLLDLSQFDAAPSACLVHLSFECDGAFPTQC